MAQIRKHVLSLRSLSPTAPLHTLCLTSCLCCSFQYRLKVKQIYDMYMAFKDQHRQIVFNTGKHLVSNGAANFTAYQFFNDKQGIAKDIQFYMNQYFEDRLYSYIDAFQINTVHLPDKFEAAIQVSLNTKQNITRTKKMVDNVKVQLSTLELVAEKDANSTIAKAKGEAAAVLAAANAAASMTKQTLWAAAEGYVLVKNQLNLQTGNNSDSAKSEMLSYVYNDALSSPAFKDTQFLVGAAPGTYINNKKGK